jgi:ABC-type branched-subunit amino acid transport system ATPase component
MTLLTVQNLCKAFGGLRAVDGVDFALEAGERLALIGPNGAGKSTTFAMLGGQLRPDAGPHRLAGQELAGRSPGAIWRLGVGRTFQIAHTFASFSVAENIQLALLSRDRKLYAPWPRAARHRRAEALALLDQVGLAGQADRPCRELAYGDIKRVELALAIAHSPRLLLLDEPAAGMAAAERHALMALVTRLVRERGLAALFTEHSMDVVFAHADRILVMARGRVIAHGPPAAIRADPRVRAVYLGDDLKSDWGDRGGNDPGSAPNDVVDQHPRAAASRK